MVLSLCADEYKKKKLFFFIPKKKKKKKKKKVSMQNSENFHWGEFPNF